MLKKNSKITISFEQLCSMIGGLAKAELLLNAIECEVPHKYIKEMITNQKEPDFIELINDLNRR